MIVTISGKSASGKTSVADAMSSYGTKRIVTYTTRAPREGETNGVDYHFVSKEDFDRLRGEGFFAEVEEYSEGRFYGTSVSDIRDAQQSDDVYVAVLTPGGVRAFERALDSSILKVFVDVPDAMRVKRYIDRTGPEKMTIAELSECFERVQRDCGMFQGFAEEADVVYKNTEEYSGLPFEPNPVDDIAKDIFLKAGAMINNREREDGPEL